MRRFLLTVAGLLAFAVAVLLILDRVNVALITASSGTAAYKMLRLFETHPKEEIPILGSSRASQNFAPSRLSPRAFNYGMDGSGQSETLFLLAALLRQEGAAPILVNLDPWGFVGSPAPSLVGDYCLVLGDPDVRARLPPEKRRLKARIPGFRFHGALREHLAAWLNARLAVTKQLDAGATLQLLSRTPEEWAFINASITPQTFAFSEEWRRLLSDVLALADRPVVWVIGPCAPRWAELYTGREALRGFLRWLAAQPNQHVIDLFDLPYGEDLFMDPTHLNLQGAERFTTTVLGELRERPGLAPFFP